MNLLALLLGAVLRLSRLARSLLTLRSSGHRGGRVLAGTIRYRIRSSDGSSGSAGSRLRQAVQEPTLDVRAVLLLQLRELRLARLVAMA